MAKLTASTNVSEFLVSEDDAAARLSLGVDKQSLTLIADASNVVTGFTLSAIPDNWKIGDSSLTALSLSDQVTTIGSNAFASCSGFTGSLVIPSSIITIGEQAFSGCSSFAGTLTIGSSVTSIGSGSFQYCSGFTGSLTIPNSVTSIGNYAFQNCSGFAGALTIGSSVTTIGNYAFFNCSGFAGSLTIPSSVTSIGNYAFYNCGSISSANILIAKTIIDAATNCLAASGITTIRARASDATWTAGAGQTIGGKSGITVIKDL